MQIKVEHSPYSLDYIHKMSQVGLAPEFQTSMRGKYTQTANVRKLDVHRRARQRRNAEVGKRMKANPLRVPWGWETSDKGKE